MSLLDASNERRAVIDSNFKLTMLVFWASWCGPCRTEIPALKEIQTKYKDKGLNLISISIDDNTENWIKALDEEKMPWPQHIVDKDKIDLVRQQFNFSAIPLVVFTDASGREVMKCIGNDKVQKEKYETVIDKFLQQTN